MLVQGGYNTIFKKYSLGIYLRDIELLRSLSKIFGGVDIECMRMPNLECDVRALRDLPSLDLYLCIFLVI